MALTLDQNLISFLLNQPLMSGIDESGLQVLIPYLEVLTFEPGATIFNEGDLSNDLYLIFEGEVSLIKQTGQGHSYVIGNLVQGEVFGEMSFIDDSPRSCDVATNHNLTLIKLARKEGKEFSPFVQQIYEKIVRNLAKLTIRRIREANDKFSKAKEIETRKFRLHTDFMKLLLNVMLATIVVSACSGALYLSGVMQQAFFLINWIAVLSILPLMWFFVKSREASLKIFGLTAEHRGGGMAKLLGLISILIALACATIYFVSYARGAIGPSLLPMLGALLLYPLYAFATEFVLRGVIQTLIWKLPLNGARWNSIGYTAILVAACNAFFGFSTVFAVLILNLVCGFIYAKEKNIFSSTIAHIIMGLALHYMGLLPFANLT